MKLIKPSFEIIEQQCTCNKMDATAVQKREWLLNGIYKQIELAGRTCYKSEDKITEDSAKGFVERMIKSGHGAMLEHGTVYLKDRYDVSVWEGWVNSLGYKYSQNKYSKVTNDEKSDIRTVYITTNLRVLVENGWMDDLKYLCEPTEYHEKRVTVRFTCDRGVSHEFVRHRVFSFAQESTRYCNYSKDKFNNELTFILPCWIDEKQLGNHDSINIIEEFRGFDNWADNNELSEIMFLYSLAISEQNYITLINYDWKPQQARAILPNALKTELVMTGFVSDWKHFFMLRCPVNAHPQARELAIPLQEEFINRKYI